MNLSKKYKASTSPHGSRQRPLPFVVRSPEGVSNPQTVFGGRFLTTNGHSRKGFLSLLLCSILLMLTSCARRTKQIAQPTTTVMNQQPLIPDMPSAQAHMESIIPPTMPLAAAPAKHSKNKEALTPQEQKKLDFEVENQTGKTLFITCFSYIKRRAFTRWRWDKSDVYKLEHGQRTMIAIDFIEDPKERKNVFGYLALFNSPAEAQESVYELLPDNIQIDLDQLEKLKGKTVVIQIEKYGKRDFYEYDFEKKTKGKQRITKRVDTLDFPIENQTGKPICVVCFTYQKRAKGTWVGAEGAKDDMALWHYKKEPVIKLMPGQAQMVHVSEVIEGRDQEYVQGHLGLFEEFEEQLAQEVTYERLARRRHLALGRLININGKKVVLEIEKYGVANDFIDYRIKPTRTIDFTKLREPRSALLKEKTNHETTNDTSNLPA